MPLPKIGLPPIFGSGGGEGVSDPVSTFISALNEILMLPFNAIQSALTATTTPATQDSPGWGAREFAPHGEIVPMMTTKEIKSKNIFGTGGRS